MHHRTVPPLVLVALLIFSTSAVSRSRNSGGGGGGDRLVVTDGLVRQRSTGEPFLAKGVNFGMRLTPQPPPADQLYNASDPFIAQKLLPGMNLIRLVLDYYSGGTCVTDIFDASAAENGYIKSEWLQHIDNVVQWSAAADVKVVITFRNNNGTATPHSPGVTTSDIPCDADYIGNITARRQWFDTWKFIANRYLNADNIAWYEVASEPHLLHSAPDPKSPSGKPWATCHTGAEVTSLFNSVVAAIRSVDSHVPIAAAPTGYEACPGLDLALDKLDDSNIIYALNWPCRLSSVEGVGYGGVESCANVAKVKGGVVTGTGACIKPCSNSNRDPAQTNFTYDASVVDSLYAPAHAFRMTHNVPLWIDQLMCPPGIFPNALSWLEDSMQTIGFDNTHFSWWAWKAANSGAETMAVLTNPPGKVNKADATLYQVDPEVYPVYKASFPNHNKYIS